MSSFSTRVDGSWVHPVHTDRQRVQKQPQDKSGTGGTEKETCGGQEGVAIAKSF